MLVFLACSGWLFAVFLLVRLWLEMAFNESLKNRLRQIELDDEAEIDYLRDQFERECA